MNIPSGIIFDSSYVLGFIIQPRKAILELDMAISSQHRHYHAPARGEAFCYTKSFLIFEVTEYRSIDLKPKVYFDGDRLADFGNLDSIGIKDGLCTIVGDFGIISMRASSIDEIGENDPTWQSAFNRFGSTPEIRT